MKKLVIESLEELFELRLPGKDPEEILKLPEIINMNPDELFMKSINNHFLKGVEKAVDAGVDVTQNNNAAIYWSVIWNNYDITKYLLANGADPHRIPNYVIIDMWSKEKFKDIVKLIRYYKDKK